MDNKMFNLRAVQLAVVVLGLAVVPTLQHGMLFTPPSRSTAWRKGFPTPPNYSDNQLNCGGMGHQWGQNGGMCGECGDPWDVPVGQRPNQVGGLYATGTIVGEYTQGQIMDVTIQITAMHQGWYEFRLCPVNDPTVPATWECLNQNLLEFEDGTTRYNIGSEAAGVYDFRLRLPADVTCSQCVLQWMWHCGNSWGTDPDGEECIGCGPQEQFYGCADIAIQSDSDQTTTDAVDTDPPTDPSTEATTTTDGVDTDPPTDPTTTTEAVETDPPTESTSTATSEAPETTTAATQPPNGNCIWIGADGAGTDQWCMVNCYYQPPFCPDDMCECSA